MPCIERILKPKLEVAASCQVLSYSGGDAQCRQDFAAGRVAYDGFKRFRDIRQML